MKGLGFNQLIDSLLAINTILWTQLESHQGISRNFQQTLHCSQDFDLNLELPFIKGFENWFFPDLMDLTSFIYNEQLQANWQTHKPRFETWAWKLLEMQMETIIRPKTSLLPVLQRSSFLDVKEWL